MAKGKELSRRDVLAVGLRGAGLLGLASGLGATVLSQGAEATVWQIDPNVCIACGNCAINCVSEPSAVRCVHAFSMCGYCDLCPAYFTLDHVSRDSGAENQLCPTGALRRRAVGDPYFQYTIDEDLCIACGKCVKGCLAYGNGSLHLQIRHDRCLNCNECAIARGCPSGAVIRVAVSDPYRIKDREERR